MKPEELEKLVKSQKPPKLKHQLAEIEAKLQSWLGVTGPVGEAPGVPFLQVTARPKTRRGETEGGL